MSLCFLRRCTIYIKSNFFISKSETNLLNLMSTLVSHSIRIKTHWSFKLAIITTKKKIRCLNRKTMQNKYAMSIWRSTFNVRIKIFVFLYFIAPSEHVIEMSWLFREIVLVQVKSVLFTPTFYTGQFFCTWAFVLYFELLFAVWQRIREKNPYVVIENNFSNFENIRAVHLRLPFYSKVLDFLQ